jgi:hypothetical protein
MPKVKPADVISFNPEPSVRLEVRPARCTVEAVQGGT